MSNPIQNGFKETKSNNSDKSNEIAAAIDTIIPIDDANTIIQNHADISIADDGSAKPIELITKDNEPIKGFYFPKHELLTALGEDGTGIYLAFAKHDGKIDPEETGNTIVLYGVKPDPDFNNEEKTIEVENRIFEYSKPCPKKCPKKRIK